MIHFRSYAGGLAGVWPMLSRVQGGRLKGIHLTSHPRPLSREGLEGINGVQISDCATVFQVQYRLSAESSPISSRAFEKADEAGVCGLTLTYDGVHSLIMLSKGKDLQ